MTDELIETTSEGAGEQAVLERVGAGEQAELEQEGAGEQAVSEHADAGEQVAPEHTDAGEQAASEHVDADNQGKTTIFGRSIDRSTAIKFAGLIAFIVVIAIIVAVMWPYIADVFTEGGVDRLVERVRNAGPGGVFILLGMQFLQIIVAFIPGEVVQLAAGLMYGPWLGALIILIGCVCSSAIVYKLVHALGAPFVQSMVSTEHLEKFRKFEESGKLDVVVFILFLIPAMPKDVFTYIVPLTDMKLGRFLTLTTLGRVPGVLASTYVAHGLSRGEMIGPIVIVAIVAILAIVAVVFRDKIMNALGKGDR